MFILKNGVICGQVESAKAVGRIFAFCGAKDGRDSLSLGFEKEWAVSEWL
jgi:hypothetical protein